MALKDHVAGSCVNTTALLQSYNVNRIVFALFSSFRKWRRKRNRSLLTTILHIAPSAFIADGFQN